ncbi:hypothetical protein D3C81_1191350 [compost metagenome]
MVTQKKRGPLIAKAFVKTRRFYFPEYFVTQTAVKAEKAIAAGINSLAEVKVLGKASDVEVKTISYLLDENESKLHRSRVRVGCQLQPSGLDIIKQGINTLRNILGRPQLLHVNVL